MFPPMVIVTGVASLVLALGASLAGVGLGLLGWLAPILLHP